MILQLMLLLMYVYCIVYIYIYIYYVLYTMLCIAYYHVLMYRLLCMYAVYLCCVVFTGAARLPGSFDAAAHGMVWYGIVE